MTAIEHAASEPAAEIAVTKMVMMKHQAEAFQWCKHRGTIGLFYEMRLGKTLIAIRWANKRAYVERILVVCPISAIDGWVEHLKAEGEDPVVLVGSKKKRKQTLLDNKDGRWFIINWEGLKEIGHKTRTGRRKAVPSDFALLPWDLVIADESTRIRKPKSAITQVACGWLSSVPNKALLTGLPNPEGPEDFVSQMIFLRGEFMGCKTFWQWRAKYMQPAGYDWVVKRSAMRLMREEVDAHCRFLTRKQAGIGSKKIYEQRYVELPTKIKRAIAKAERDFEIGDRLAVNKLQIATWIAQLTGGRYPDESLHHNAKINELIELVRGELKNEPMVVYCRFTDEILAVADALKKAGKKVGVAYGADKSGKALFKRGKIDYLVGQPNKVLQMGVDLSIADTEVYYSNWYDYEVRAQSEDRIEHPKKNEPLLILDLLAKDTVDEDAFDVLRDKKINAINFKKAFLAKFLERINQRRAA